MRENRKMIFILAAIISVWEIVTAFDLVSSLFFASPSSIIISLFELAAQDTVLFDLLATFWRTAVAFALSVIIGTSLGISIGYLNEEGMGLETFLDFLRSIPPIALFPLFMFFFGIGDLSKIAVGAFAGTMIITIAGIYGVRQINRVRLKLARKIGLRGERLFFKVLLPESLGNIFGGYRVAASFCLILVIVTEMSLGGAGFGLGKRLIDAQMLYNIPQLYALIFISGVMGYLINESFVIAENRVMHWRGN